MKLQEALIKKKDLENIKEELYSNLRTLSALRRKEISEEEKKAEVERFLEHIKDLKQIIRKTTAMQIKIQRAGFKAGIKDKLVELEELRRYYNLLDSLLKKSPMGKVEWKELERGLYDGGVEEVEVFLPIDREWVEKEKREVKKKIMKLDTEIQGLNWKVDVKL